VDLRSGRIEHAILGFEIRWDFFYHGGAQSIVSADVPTKGDLNIQKKRSQEHFLGDVPFMKGKR
jgi:hypothetical protein